MTSPVTHLPQSDASHTISFVLPEGMSQRMLRSTGGRECPHRGETRLPRWPRSVGGEGLMIAGARKPNSKLTQPLFTVLVATTAGGVFFARYDPPDDAGVFATE
jgi:hypothetical protein